MSVRFHCQCWRGRAAHTIDPPRRVLITLDAVGGVWRYAVDVARGLAAFDITCLLVGFGPEPDAIQRAECEAVKNAEIAWTNEPLDWMVSDPAELDAGATKLMMLARKWNADLLHLNLPSQAAGLECGRPVVVASHSCVPTWWEAVRGTELPSGLTWQRERNLGGLRRADAVLTPSESHGAALRAVYGQLPPLHVVYNAVAITPSDHPKDRLFLAVGRWWDEGKNGTILDAAAAFAPWPIVLAGPLSGPNEQSIAFSNVKTTGSLAHHDILGLLRRAAIFAAPSRYEPFGLAVAEAAICGAALVLADIPTFRELWDDAGLFVAPDDADGWRQAFATLAADAPRRRMLAAQAAERASQFTLQRQTERLRDLYTTISPAAVT
jgi:glycosyltransferase involved in cell wall biosynthesis